MHGTRLTRREALASAAVALSGSIAGCSGDGGDGGDAVVTVGPGGALEFDPEELTVAVGDTVTWEWGSGGHNVNPQSQPADANWQGEQDLLERGAVHEHTFEVAGTYEYQCDPHAASGMVGTVIVEE